VKSTATPTPRDQLRNRLTSSIGTGKSRKGMLGSFELFLKSLPQLTYYERVEKWTKISASSEASADNTVDVDLEIEVMLLRYRLDVERGSARVSVDRCGGETGV